MGRLYRNVKSVGDVAARLWLPLRFEILMQSAMLGRNPSPAARRIKYMEVLHGKMVL